MVKKRRLLDEYRFPGFRPRAKVKGIFGDSKARVIRLERRQKKRHAAFAGNLTRVITTTGFAGYGICRAARCGFFWNWRFAAYFASVAGK